MLVYRVFIATIKRMHYQHANYSQRALKGFPEQLDLQI